MADTLHLHRRHARTNGPGNQGRLRRPAAVRRRDRHCAPITARSSAGWATAKCGSSRAGRRSVYYVDGGFVQVADNVVAVLTNRAVPAKSLDPAAAETQLQAALGQPANTPELFEIRDRQVAQAVPRYEPRDGRGCNSASQSAASKKPRTAITAAYAPLLKRPILLSRNASRVVAVCYAWRLPT